MRPFAIVPYPLSSAFRDRLVERVGEELVEHDVPSLRRLGIGAMLRTLRRHRGAQCFIPLEDAASTALLPVLELLAASASPSSITVVDASGSAASLSRLHAFRSAGGLLEASVAVRRHARSAGAELDALLAASRASVTPGSARRVLYVNANLWFGVKAGGSIGHVAGVVNGLLDTGLEVDVAAVAPQPLVRHEASFVSLPAPRRFGLPSELNQYLFSRSSTRRLQELTGERRYAFVYQRLSLGSYVGAAVSRTASLPLVLEYNGSEVWIARNWGNALRREDLGQAAEEASLRHAHVVVTVSDVLGEELSARGVDPARIVVYPNCVDPTLFDPDRLAPERDRVRTSLALSDAVVVTFVGTFGAWHGAETLARAISRLAVEQPRWLDEHRVRFLLVGAGLRMPHTIEALGDAGRAVTMLTGLVPQAEAPAYLAASDVLVSPHVPNGDGTRFFGSPTKLFEYMAMAKPIVASDLDQIGDVLSPALRAEASPAGQSPDGGEVAVLVRPGDVDDLVRGIRRVVEDPALRARLGERARERVHERYTWQHHVGAILDRIRSVTS